MDIFRVQLGHLHNYVFLRVPKSSYKLNVESLLVSIECFFPFDSQFAVSCKELPSLAEEVCDEPSLSSNS